MDDEIRRLQKIVYNRVFEKINDQRFVCDERWRLLCELSDWLIAQQEILVSF